MILIFILALFTNLSSGRLSQSDLLTSTTQKSWYIHSMTPDERCSSSSDDTWIFFADGTFEYNHGAVRYNEGNQCADLVNLSGTWQLTNNESTLSITGLHEKGNAANSFSLTLLQGEINLLEEERLVLTVTDPSSNNTFSVEFRKKL